MADLVSNRGGQGNRATFLWTLDADVPGVTIEELARVAPDRQWEAAGHIA